MNLLIFFISKVGLSAFSYRIKQRKKILFLNKICRMKILCLDGGGSKGVYTLGVLREFEALIKTPLCEFFDIVYGTSTGSIIAAMIGLGYTVDEIEKKYFSLIPCIMGKSKARNKSAELKKGLEEFFGDLRFEDFKTGVSIVATNFESEKPFIFKRNAEQGYKLKSTFKPGFGATIATAVQASCAAYPIFEKVIVQTENQGNVLAVDGGFIANNPTLFAITDATKSLNIPPEDIAILTIGTGNFIETPIDWKSKLFKSMWFVQLFEKMLKSNGNTTEILIKLLFGNIPSVRINDTFNQPQYGTNMVERNASKLKLLHQLGRDSFGKHEDQVKALFKI